MNETEVRDNYEFDRVSHPFQRYVSASGRNRYQMKPGYVSCDESGLILVKTRFCIRL